MKVGRIVYGFCMNGMGKVHFSTPPAVTIATGWGVLRVGSMREECVGTKVQISLDALRIGGCLSAGQVGQGLADVFECEFACFIAPRRRNRLEAKCVFLVLE